MSLGVAAQKLQGAVYSLLSGDATLQALLASNPGVFDEPPEGQAFPYVVIGDFEETAQNRMGGKVGRRIRAEIGVWTESRGAKTVQDIAGRIDALLDNNLTLTMTGYTLLMLNLERIVIERQAILRHGILTYLAEAVET